MSLRRPELKISADNKKLYFAYDDLNPTLFAAVLLPITDLITQGCLK